jgi:glycosyltransferase 2 family protein
MVLPEARRWPLLRAYLATFFYALLPTGQLGAEATKLSLAATEQLRLARVAASIGFDKVTSLVALMLIGAIALLISDDRIGFIAGAGLGAAAVALIASLGAAPRIEKGILAYGSSHWFAARIGSFAGALADLARHPALLGLSVVAGVITQGLLVLFCIFMADAVGIEIGLAAFIGAVVIANIAAVLPVSIAGIGVRELGFVALLGRHGVSAESALAFSLGCLGMFLCAAALGLIAQMLPARPSR